MKFDTVIVGGGLAGLTAGIHLQSHGRQVAIVTSGQSALHFSCGSFELMGSDANKCHVANPLEAIDKLDASHPYTRVGMPRIKSIIPQVCNLLREAGLKPVGTEERNHLRLSPLGIWKPAWLTLEGYVMEDSLESLSGRNVALVNLQGFLDFYPRFIAAGLERHGADCISLTISNPTLDRQRQMRSTTVARILNGKAVNELADAINRVVPEKCTDIIFPAVVGGSLMKEADRLRSMVNTRLRFVATTGTSVPGVEAQIALQKYFRRLGGTYLAGDTVVSGNIVSNRLESLKTANFAEDLLRAENFIFAGGSFFSNGLNALPDRIEEPVLGLDVKAPTNRSEWFDKNIFNEQPFMAFGIATDQDFHALRGNRPLENVYVVGSALAGAHSLREGSGAGVATITAMNIADCLTK